MKRKYQVIVFILVISANHALDAQSASWIRTTLPASDLRNSTTSLFVSGQYFFAGTDGSGVFRSTNNGTTWAAVNSGLTNKSVYSLISSGKYLFAGTYSNGLGDIFRSADNGANWTLVHNNASANATINSFAILNSFLFAGGYQNGVYSSTDSGATWIKTNTTSPIRPQYVLSLFATAGYLFAGTEDSLFRSHDNGGSWDVVMPSVSYYWYSFTSAGNYIFAGMALNLYRSNTNGTTWNEVNNSLLSSIRAFSESGTNIFAGANSGLGLFRSADTGSTWTLCNLMNPNIYSLAISGGYIFAGSDSVTIWRRPLSDMIRVPSAPVLSSPSNGATNQPVAPTISWNSAGAVSYELQVATNASFINTLYDNTSITGTSILSNQQLSSGTVYFWRVNATNANGTGIWSSIWSFSTGPATAVFLQQNPISAGLSGVTGQAATLRYFLPASCYVKITYFDIKGRLIASLINQYQNAGFHSFPISISSLLMGAYLQVFEAGNIVKKDKIVLFR